MSENYTQESFPIGIKLDGNNHLVLFFQIFLLLFSAIGNITAFIKILSLRRKSKLSRINLFLLHLSIADLLVTFLILPLEIGWATTVSWNAGDIMCRVMAFFRVFGLNLSSFIIVCISLDRYFAVLKPLGIANAKRRGKIMLSIAWIASIVCSLPQPFIFHVEEKSEPGLYDQCVTYDSFSSREAELLFKILNFLILYGFPLLMIIYCYLRILLEICRANSVEQSEKVLRRSSKDTLARAKAKVLKMTIIIATTFFIFWTPHHVLSIWCWFNNKPDEMVDPQIQNALLALACTTSCANPLIYGIFDFGKGKKYMKILSWLPKVYGSDPEQNQRGTT